MTDRNQSPLVGNEACDGNPADQGGQSGMLRRAGRSVFSIVLIFGGLFFLFLLGMTLMSSFSLEGMASFQERLSRADSMLMFVRLLLIGVLIVFWRPLNSGIAKRNDWSEVHLQRVLAGRWWALTLLLFVELILVQRLHESLLGMAN